MQINYFYDIINFYKRKDKASKARIAVKYGGIKFLFKQFHKQSKDCCKMQGVYYEMDKI